MNFENLIYAIFKQAFKDYNELITCGQEYSTNSESVKKMTKERRYHTQPEYSLCEIKDFFNSRWGKNLLSMIEKDNTTEVSRLINKVMIGKEKVEFPNIKNIKNKILVDRYPFLIPRNRRTDKVVDNYDYHFTELDAMPNGWRIAFGEQMCREIYDELIRAGCLDKYRILQIKEKHGSLCWYNSRATEKILREIIPKYSKLSQRTCIRCGKPATKISLGWISPWCDECADKIKRHERFESVETYFKTCEDCAYYDTDEDDIPCCGCVDKFSFEPMEAQNDE